MLYNNCRYCIDTINCLTWKLSFINCFAAKQKKKKVLKIQRLNEMMQYLQLTTANWHIDFQNVSQSNWSSTTNLCTKCFLIDKFVLFQNFGHSLKILLYFVWYLSYKKQKSKHNNQIRMALPRSNDLTLFAGTDAPLLHF